MANGEQDDQVSYHAELRPDWTRSQHLQYVVRAMMGTEGAPEAAIERVAGAAGVYYVLLENTVVEAMIGEAARLFAVCAGPGARAELDAEDLRVLLWNAAERVTAHGRARGEQASRARGPVRRAATKRGWNPGKGR